MTKSVFILANSADPDETPNFAASHLGLRCLYMFFAFSLTSVVNGRKRVKNVISRTVYLNS